MRQIGVLALLLWWISAPALAARWRTDGYANWRYFTRRTNHDSLWNPGNLLGLEARGHRGRLNLESRFGLGKARLVASPAATVDHEGDVTTALRELYGTVSLGDFELTAGKSIVKLGTGYLFTPLSVISRDLVVSDPEDELRDTEGVNLLKLDYYSGNANLGLVLFEREKWRNLAFLAYTHFRGIDFYGLISYPETKKPEVGVALSTTVGDRVEIHAELMVHRDAPVEYHAVYFADHPETSFHDDPLFHPELGYYKELVVGTQVTVRGIHVIAEYYHNDWGLRPRWWDRLKRHYQYHLATQPDPSRSADVQSDLRVISQGSARGLMRDYLFVRGSKSFPRARLTGIVYLNLHDGSTVNVVEAQAWIRDGVVLFLQPTVFLGHRGTEFGESWYAESVQFGVRTAF